MLRMLLLLPFIIFTLLMVPISAEVVVQKIEMTPPILLPGDIADCKLTLTAMKDCRVTVTFFTPLGIEVEPSSVYIGYLSAGASYTLPFTLKAKKSGIYIINIYIYALNKTIKQVMVVRVEDKYPKIVLHETTFTLNEVNKVDFSISSNLNLTNIIVKPLFDADPRVIYVKDSKGSFKFCPTKQQNLSFEIEFYNGKNYHKIIQIVHPQYKMSKGLILNINTYPTALLYDTIPIIINVTNLRNDVIYSTKITLTSNSGIFLKDYLEIPILKSMESKSFKILYTPIKAGKNVIEVELAYSDELNNVYNIKKSVTIDVSREYALTLGNINIDVKGVSGEICNLGKGKVYNVMIQFGEYRYYIGTIDPQDFDTFELPYANVSFIKVSWNNELGEKFEINFPIKIQHSYKVKGEEHASLIPLIVAIAVLIAVIVIVIKILKR